MVFKALNIISHWIDQLSKDWRSECILSADTAGLESTIYMRQASSAYNLMAHAKFITMSSKCTRKSKGPKIDPCGTPASTGRVSEWWPSSTTRCTRWSRYDEIHVSKFPEISFRFCLNRTPLCHTLSNAFDKSRKTILTSLPSSKASVNLCVMDNSWEQYRHQSGNQNCVGIIIYFPSGKNTFYCKQAFQKNLETLQRRDTGL